MMMFSIAYETNTKPLITHKVTQYMDSVYAIAFSPYLLYILAKLSKWCFPLIPQEDSKVLSLILVYQHGTFHKYS